MLDEELKTARELKELAAKTPEHAELLNRAAREIEDLIERLDGLYRLYRGRE